MQQQVEHKVIHQIPVSHKQSRTINGTTGTYIFSIIHLGKTPSTERLFMYKAAVKDQLIFNHGGIEEDIFCFHLF